MADVFISIPHAGIDVPDPLRPRLRDHVDDRFLRSMSDVWTDEVYAVPGVDWARYPWSRFVADPNRGESQLSEGGVVPHTDFDEQPLYRPGQEPGPDERARRVDLYHRPYHEVVARRLTERRYRVYLDGHSMASRGPERSPDRGLPRPDATLSNLGDEWANPAPGVAYLTAAPERTRDAADALQRLLRACPAPRVAGAIVPTGDVRINDPFPAGYGVRRHARPKDGLPGLQVELNQGLWCDERRWTPWPGRLPWIREVMERWVEDLGRIFAP